MFSASVREIKREYPDKKVFLLGSNKSKGRIRRFIVNLLQKKYSWNSSPVFYNNPYLAKGWIGRNSFIVDRTDWNNRYFEKELEDRYLWKDNKHAVEIICENYGVTARSIKPDIFFNDVENKVNHRILNGLPESYIAIEPNGKTDYFSTNRLWFLDRWQKLVNKLSLQVGVVQVGDGKGKLLNNVINYNGKLSFRETAWLISRAQLFVGTVGGLMHTSRAVDTKSVILYSGTEAVGMAGYEENINLVKSVECSPCGLKVRCPYEKKCIDFSVEEIYEKVLKNI